MLWFSPKEKSPLYATVAVASDRKNAESEDSNPMTIFLRQQNWWRDGFEICGLWFFCHNSSGKPLWRVNISGNQWLWPDPHMMAGTGGAIKNDGRRSKRRK